MRVRVRLRYEDGGRPIALWRQGFEDEWDAEGILLVRTEPVKDLNDHVKVARLMPFEVAAPVVLEPLYRAEMFVEAGRVRIIGVEQDTLTRKFTAQAWACVLMRDQGEEQRAP